MPDLDFQVEDAAALIFAAVPTVSFRLRITNRGEEPVHSLMLNTQLRIMPRQRAYSPPEQERLVEVFGPSSGWERSLNSLLWAQTVSLVPPFEASTTVEMLVPCTYDFDVVSAKYFHALAEGEVPVQMLFSGTIFYAGETGLQTTRIPWEKEAEYRLPVSVWKDVMDHYFPNSAWLRLHKETFDRLYGYKARHGFSSWDLALEHLLSTSGEEVETSWAR